MKKKIVITAIALVLIIAIVLVVLMFISPKKAQPTPVETTPVIVETQPIETTPPVTKPNEEIVDWSKKYDNYIAEHAEETKYTGVAASSRLLTFKKITTDSYDYLYMSNGGGNSLEEYQEFVTNDKKMTVYKTEDNVRYFTESTEEFEVGFVPMTYSPFAGNVTASYKDEWKENDKTYDVLTLEKKFQLSSSSYYVGKCDEEIVPYDFVFTKDMMPYKVIIDDVEWTADVENNKLVSPTGETIDAEFTYIDGSNNSESVFYYDVYINRDTQEVEFWKFELPESTIEVTMTPYDEDMSGFTIPTASTEIGEDTPSYIFERIGDMLLNADSFLYSVIE